jgi:alpha-1,6-mannosyltransferase
MATTTEPPATGDGERAAVSAPTPPAGDARPPAFPYRTIALGTAGSTVLMLGALGAGGILLSDPVLGAGPLSWLRFGHGKALATAVVYLGFALIVWAWVRLGRYVLRGRVGTRPVLIAGGCWMAPLLVSPPLFTRDVFSYLGQGAQLLHGHDPYEYGPAVLDVLPRVVENVHWMWQTTPAPYGPGFLWISQYIVAATGDDMIAGVILTRLVLLLGLAGMLWGLPRLVRRLGGNLPVTMWLAVASPMTVVHLVGGPHNDLLMLGFLVVGVVLALERKHALAIAVVTVGMLIKPTAALALPFLVWVWANHLPPRPKLANLVLAGAPSVGIFGVVFVAGTWGSLGSFNLGWITGLEAPTLITNWLNLPTGVGQGVGGFVRLFADVEYGLFISGARAVAIAALAAVIAWQWWLARDGGNRAVFHMGVTLLAAAMLAPPTLPWYLTWGFVILAAFAWQRRHLAIMVAASVFLVLAYYPTGEQALYNWWYVAGVVAVSWYAAKSLLKPDPLGVIAAIRGERAEPSQTSP